MAKPALLPYPTSPEDLVAKMHTLFPEEQLVQAKHWANTLAEKSLTPAKEDLWVLRQCFRYMPPETIVCYLSMNVVYNKPQEVEAFWLGTPPDWEGAVRMMEAAYSENGWRAVLYPSVLPPYTASQAARMLRLLQKTGDLPRKENVKVRDALFLEGFDDRLPQKPSMAFWRNPHTWLTGHKLSKAEQIAVWCAYALLADPDILMRVSKGLRWKGWEVGEYLLDWEAVTSADYAERELAAEQLWTAHNTKTVKVQLPPDIDFTVGM